jgi:hypothetical protein
MTQRTVNYAAGEKLEELVSLKDITVSHNPRASLRGVLDLFHSEGSASNSPESRQGFVAYMQEEHPEIDMLRLSIQDHSLLHAPTLRSFRAKEGDNYVQRYGIVMGEGRILSYALLEAMTGVPQKVRVRVESRLSVDSAFEQGLVENLDRNEMNPVDLAVAFHEMLTIRINPATKSAELNGQPNPLYAPKGRPYTMKELAERVRKTYQWVRMHEALFYLPAKYQLQCVKAWQDGQRNITKFCKLGLGYKAKVTGQSEEVGLDNQTPTPDTLTVNDGTSTEVVGTENVAVASTENSSETETQFKSEKRRRVLTYKAVVELFDKTALENKERLSTLAEVMGLKLEDALNERDIRLAQQADIQARKQQKAA